MELYATESACYVICYNFVYNGFISNGTHGCDIDNDRELISTILSELRKRYTKIVMLRYLTSNRFNA